MTDGPTSRRSVAAATGSDHESAAPRARVLLVDAHPSWRQWFNDLRVYHGALRSLALRNIRSRYKQAVLGVTWALVQPALQVGVFTVLFGALVRVPTNGVPYPLFALAGLLPWNLFSKITTEGATSLVVNQHIITKLFFPRIYLVVAAGASALLDAVVTLLLLGVLLALYGIAPGFHIWLALPALLGTVLFSFGFAALLAAINARWRDVQHTLPFALQIGMFVTPVVYRESFLPERWRWLLAFNPLTAWVDAFRASVVGVSLPEADVLYTSLGISLLIAFTGFWLFRRSEAFIVDVV